MSACIVLCTTPSTEEATQLAHKLIENDLCACVTLRENLTSIYKWEGAVCTDQECVLFIKTKMSLFDELSDFIAEHHSYDVPEIIALPIEKGNNAYLQWIETNTKEPTKCS